MLTPSRIVILLCCVMGMSVLASAQDNTLSPVECPVPLPNGAVVECYTLSVPENRTDPASSTITLAIAVLRHPDGATHPDPILFLQGGPGGNTLDTLERAFDNRFEPLFATGRDIILFDQRGVGQSIPALNCPVYQSAATDALDYEIDGETLSVDALDSYLADLLHSCGRALATQHDLTGYNSIESAADIDAIRVALGYEQINLWGVSYGTRLALTAMRDFSDGINRVVLDSVYPLEANLFTETPANFNRSLETLFAACAADEACDRAFPELETVFYATIDALNENPLRMDAPDALSRTTYENVVFDGTLFADMMFRLFYVTNLLPNLPELIYEAHTRDTTRWSVIVGWLAPQRDTISIGMYYAVQCQEEAIFTPTTGIAEAWAAFPQFTTLADRAFDDTDLAAVCAAFQAGDAPTSEDMPIISDLETLIITGAYDPITPPAWGIQVADQLPNSFYIDLPATGHGPTGSQGCAQDILIDFFTRDNPQATDMRCVSTLSLDFSGTQRGDFNNIDSADVLPSGTLTANP